VTGVTMIVAGVVARMAMVVAVSRIVSGMTMIAVAMIIAIAVIVAAVIVVAVVRSAMTGLTVDAAMVAAWMGYGAVV